jgi:hypothetical protein
MRFAAALGMQPTHGTRERGSEPALGITAEAAQSSAFMRLYRARWMLGVVAAVACKASPPASEGLPGASPPAQGGDTNAAAPGMQANGGTAGAAAVERPSVQDNMGRAFQGALKLRVRGTGGERQLAFLASGNRARIQIDSVRGNNFDALVWDDSIALLDHERKTYAAVPLDGLEPGDEPKVDIERRSTGERQILQGVVCEPYELTQGPYVISTCVSGVPGDFDVDKFETVSALDVPAWAESLLADHLLPIVATVREGGRELYRVELIEYSPAPIDAASLTLPASYQPRDPQRPVSRE